MKINRIILLSAISIFTCVSAFGLDISAVQNPGNNININVGPTGPQTGEIGKFDWNKFDVPNGTAAQVKFIPIQDLEKDVNHSLNSTKNLIEKKEFESAAGVSFEFKPYRQTVIDRNIDTSNVSNFLQNKANGSDGVSGQVVPGQLIIIDD